MRPKPSPSKATPGERVAKDIRRATCKLNLSEEKIWVVLTGLRSDDRVAEMCGKKGMVQKQKWFGLFEQVQMFFKWFSALIMLLPLWASAV